MLAVLFLLHVMFQSCKVVKKRITYCKIKAIDVKQFEADVMASNLENLDSFNSVSEAVLSYRLI